MDEKTIFNGGFLTKKLPIALCYLFATTAFAQNAEEIKEIQQKTEVAKLATLYTSFEENQFLQSLAIQAGRDIAKTLLSCNEDTDVVVAFEGSVIQKNAFVFNSFINEIKSAQKNVQVVSSRPANESVFYL